MTLFFADVRQKFLTRFNAGLAVIFVVIAITVERLALWQSVLVPEQIISLAEVGMFTQPIVIWLLVTDRSRQVPGVAIFGFLMLQTSGAIRAFGAPDAWLLASMLVALLGSVTLATPLLRSALSGYGRLGTVMLWSTLALVFAGIGFAGEAVLTVRPLGWLHQAAGPLMAFQVFAIWAFTKNAWQGYNAMGQLQFTTFVVLQVSGSLLMWGVDEWVFAAMSFSLIGTLLTGTRLWLWPQKVRVQPAE